MFVANKIISTYGDKQGNIIRTALLCSQSNLATIWEDARSPSRVRLSILPQLDLGDYQAWHCQS